MLPSQELLFLLPLQLLSMDLAGVSSAHVLLSPKAHAALVWFNSIDLAVMFASPLKELPKSTHMRMLEARAITASHGASFLVPVALLNKEHKHAVRNTS